MGAEKEPPSKKNEKIAIAVSKKGTLSSGGMATAGKGKRAEEIVRLAQEQKIEVRQDPDLVSRLLSTESSGVVPGKVYDVIAEIINFTFEVDDRMGS